MPRRKAPCRPALPPARCRVSTPAPPPPKMALTCWPPAPPVTSFWSSPPRRSKPTPKAMGLRPAPSPAPPTRSRRISPPSRPAPAIRPQLSAHQSRAGTGACRPGHDPPPHRVPRHRVPASARLVGRQAPVRWPPDPPHRPACRLPHHLHRQHRVAHHLLPWPPPSRRSSAPNTTPSPTPPQTPPCASDTLFGLPLRQISRRGSGGCEIPRRFPPKQKCWRGGQPKVLILA